MSDELQFVDAQSKQFLERTGRPRDDKLKFVGHQTKKPKINTQPQATMEFAGAFGSYLTMMCLPGA